jgi:hypothetical protein
VLEQRLPVALEIDRIGKVTQEVLDLLLGIADPVQQLLDLGMRNEPHLHAPNATPPLRRSARPMPGPFPLGGAPLDTPRQQGDNCRMRSAGFLRWRLANTLRSAYAIGLLTQDTFTLRIDDLYGASHVDPQRLVGDLTFRTQEGKRGRVHALLGALWRPRSPVSDGRERLPLLALDWTGATTDMLIGRSSACDLVLDDPTVSRRHVQLFFREGRWILLDLASRNGTYINDRRVRRSELLPGDVLAVANAELQVD